MFSLVSKSNNAAEGGGFDDNHTLANAEIFDLNTFVWLEYD